MKKVEFTVKVGDEEVGYNVRMPDGKMRKKARELKTDYFRKEVFKDGVVFTHQLQDLLKRKGLWSDEKEEEIKTVTRDIEDKIKLLSKGKSEKVPNPQVLREIIVKEVKPLRNKQLQLLTERSQLDDLSIENASQQLEVDYLISECTYTAGDDKVFQSLEDYESRKDEPYAEEAGRKLSELIGLTSSNWVMDLPENKLLIKHKFMNTNGIYLDPQGNFISSDGRPVNEQGYFINSENEIIDDNGNRITENGEIIDYTEFD